MFSTTVSTLAVLALFAFTGASAAPPTRALTVRQVSQCDTGKIQCCEQMQSAGSRNHDMLLPFLGLDAALANLPIGTACSPIDVGALGHGASCSAHPVCCDDKSTSLVSVGCVPINLSG